MAEHSHAIAYRDAKAALASGNLNAFLDWLAPEVVWWEVGATTPIVGNTHVVESVRNQGAIAVVEQIHDLLANDEHLVALVHARVEHAEESFSLSWAEVHHFDDEGRVAKRQAFPSDPAKAARVSMWRNVAR